MDRKTLWISLLGGCFLFLLGIRELYRHGDWILFIISCLIIAFSASRLAQKKGDDES